MGRVLLGTGEYAKIPYCFENLGIRVFSAEELCFVLKENAFLLDKEIVNKKLVRWIDEILGLPELAASLYPLLHQRTSVGVFASAILQYVGFYDVETVRNTEKLFHKSANLNVFEKLKTRVDYMVTNGRLSLAVPEYDALLAALPPKEVKIRAGALHNKAVALCGLFLFEEAAEEFKKSFDILPERENFISYLAAKRIAMEESEYVAFVAGFPDYYEDTLELEKRVEALRISWEESKEKHFLDECKELKTEGYMSRYYEAVDNKMQELKRKYRESVGN